ncbi:MAG: hypothetical protein OEN20_05615, partial [Gammaproteobacteria bacterium]|nr:hypothetical protein [Gammaproteobacteria bacterium]
ALVDLAVRISQFAAAAGQVASLDLNPVVVHPRGEGVSVLDALIVTGEQQTGDATADGTNRTTETAS